MTPFVVGFVGVFALMLFLLVAASFAVLVAQTAPLLIMVSLALYWRMSVCNKRLL